MKTFCILALLCSSIPALALAAGVEVANVDAMHKVPCAQGQAPQHHTGILPEILGTSSSPDDGQCVEYELSTEKVRYVVRPRVAILLSLDSDVYIRLANNELLLRTDDSPKDVHCTVRSMVLRSNDKRSNDPNSNEAGSNDQRSDEESSQRRHPSTCLNEAGDVVPCADAAASSR